MKKILLSMAMCLMVSAIKAQVTDVVTLTHEGATTNFSGVEAFVKAVAASADGDLITLSAGKFKGTTVNKSLNIRGNGVEPLDQATIIETTTTLEKSADENEDNHWLNIEGIKFTGDVLLQRPTNTTDLNILKDLKMVKCDLNVFSSAEYYPNGAYYGTTKNATFIQCRILGSATIFNTSEVSFVNSIVKNPGFARGTGDQVNNPTINYKNSVVIFGTTPLGTSYVNAFNSILLFNITALVGGYQGRDHYCIFPSTVMTENCILTGYLVDETQSDLLFTGGISHNNSQWKPITEVFKTLTEYKNFDPENDYAINSLELKGTDGTEVGIYGGFLPYSNIVTYPRFGNFTVAEKAENGKLEVNITVE